jgi:hypothetical protein
VTRVIRFGARYRMAAERLSIVPGSARGRAVGQVIAALATAEALPGIGDTHALMPPLRDAFVRRVGRRNLWLWYRVDADIVTLAHVSSEPPVPVED